MVAGDLLSDWIYAVVTKLCSAQVSFKRNWEKQSAPGSDSLENRAFRKLCGPVRPTVLGVRLSTFDWYQTQIEHSRFILIPLPLSLGSRR